MVWKFISMIFCTDWIFINHVCIICLIINTKPDDETILLGNKLILFPFKIVLLYCFLKNSYIILFIWSLNRLKCIYLFLTNKNSIYLRYTMWCFDICRQYEMITIIKLINIFITSHSYHFSMVRTLEMYNHNRIHIYNTLLLTIATTLYIRFPEIAHIITEIFHPLIIFPLFSYSQPLVSTILFSATISLT